jgi:tetratricopeptide (TPR) repeat protein
LDLLNKKISANPRNPELFNERALFYLNNNEANEAFKDIAQAIELDSSNAGYYLTLSDISLAMGRLQGSVEALYKAAELDDKNLQAMIKLAEISIVFLDYQKALEYIDKALKIDLLAPQAYFLRGVVFLENGDTIRAIRNFQQAIEVDQDFFDAHVQLGLLYAGRQNALAINYFNNALNIEPDNTDVLYNLAMFYQEAGDYNKAILHYNMILECDPDFFVAFFNLGFIHMVFLEDYTSAIDFFSEAINLRHDYAEAYYNRGLAHELMLNVEKSQADYRKSLEYKPNYDKAIEGLNRIDEYLYRKN